MLGSLQTSCWKKTKKKFLLDLHKLVNDILIENLNVALMHQILQVPEPQSQPSPPQVLHPL